MKKIVVILLLLTSLSWGATNTWNAGANSTWNTAGSWSLGTVPNTGDDVVFDNTSDFNCILDAAPTNTIKSLTVDSTYDGVLDFSGETLDIDDSGSTGCSITGDSATIADTGSGGGIECDDSLIISGAPLPDGFTVTMNGTGNVSANVSANRADLVIDTSFTHTATATAYWDTFTMTAGGTYNPNGKDHNIAGNIIYTAGTVTISGKFIQTASGNLAWNSQPSSINQLEIQATATLTANVYFRNITLGASAVVNRSAGEYLIIFKPSDNWWTQNASAVVNTPVRYYSIASDSTGGGITLADQNLMVQRGIALTADGDIDIGTGSISSPNQSLSNAAFSLDMASYALTCQNIVIGPDSRAFDSTYDLGSGTHTITGSITAASGASGTLTLQLGSSSTTLTGILDGAAVGGGSTLTCVSDANGSHPQIHGGTVQDVSMPLDDEALDCTDNVTDGGSNVNAWMPGVVGVHSVIGGGMLGSGEAQ